MMRHFLIVLTLMVLSLPVVAQESGDSIEVELQGFEVTASVQRDAEGKEIFTITNEMRRNTNNAANLLAKLPGVNVNQATETIRIGTESDIKIIVNGQEISHQYALSLNPKRIFKEFWQPAD